MFPLIRALKIFVSFEKNIYFFAYHYTTKPDLANSYSMFRHKMDTKSTKNE